MNSSKVRLYGAVAAAVLLAAAGGYGLSTLQNRGGAEAPGHPADAEHAEEGGEEAGGDVVELTQAARFAAAPTFQYMPMFGLAALYYWIICTVLSLVQDRAEERFSRYVAA